MLFKMIPLFFFLVFNAAAATAKNSRSSSHCATFDLNRIRPSSETTPLDHVRQLFHSDQVRQQTIAGRISGRNSGISSPPAPAPAPNSPSSFAMPLKSGAYSGTGQYFARLLLGTPAQKFTVVADTGSDLTWVKCRRRGRKDGGQGGEFLPEKSESYREIECSTELCKTSLPFSLATCPSPDSPCAYDYGYTDGSTARGVFANESATIMLSNGSRAKLHGLVVGCTSSFIGSSFKASDGVLGLGYSDISFASRATEKFGGRFSYCLVDHLSPRNASSYLTFGPSKSFRTHGSSQRPRITSLILDRLLQPFYGIAIETLSVDSEVLEISKSVWDVSAGGGAILDSGTSLTVLVEPAYRAVVSALSRRLTGVPRVDVDPFEYCYNWSKPVRVPKMVVHLVGPARLNPPGKSYLIDVAPDVKCIGVMLAPWPGISTIGNILQQEHIWEFDLKNRRLRFQRSKCGHR